MIEAPQSAEEKDIERARTACVPAWKLQALIDVLIAKGIITAKDMEADSARAS